MSYTVKEVSSLSGVTVKTLHYYHKIGLLLPSGISDGGYRLYGTAELERLQQILLYKSLDFKLEEIGRLLEEVPERTEMLRKQEELLLLRKRKLETIIGTLRQSIAHSERGEPMEAKDMFKGLENEGQWREALAEQQAHLQQTYGYDLNEAPIDAAAMNEMAAEGAAFMQRMAASLRAGIKHSDESVKTLLRDHLAFLNGHGHETTAAGFVRQTRFFLEDDFHRRMLEDQQTGLGYYLFAAAEAYSAAD